MKYKWFQSLSVQYKLLISNLLMIIVPIIILFLLVGALWGVLRFSDPVSQRSWMMLAPSTLQSQIFEFELEQINKKLWTSESTVSDIRNNTAVVEAQGLDVVIMKDDEVLYATPGVDGFYLASNVLDSVHDESHDIQYYEWDEDRVIYVNRYGSGLLVIGSGRIPFLAKTMGRESEEKVLVETIFGFVIICVLASVVLCGVYLANRLSRQILSPLYYLQAAATDIKNGIIPQPIDIINNDELGNTCEAFNSMQQSLAKEKALREEYEEKRHRMIAGICHDIATPLTSVKGYASGILEGVAQTEEKRARYVQMIYDMSGRIEKLVNMLSDFSKLELGQIQYQYDIVVMDRLVSDYIKDRYVNFGENEVMIHQTYGCPGQQVRIDTVQFGRVLDNIFSNSWKYRGTDPLQISIATTCGADRLRLTVTDNGIGVPEEMLNRLFDIFFRTDTARSEVAQGNGIGLAIVKQIVTDMQGCIWAEQGPGGRGLVIVMEFPAVTDSEKERS